MITNKYSRLTFYYPKVEMWQVLLKGRVTKHLIFYSIQGVSKLSSLLSRNCSCNTTMGTKIPINTCGKLYSSLRLCLYLYCLLNPQWFSLTFTLHVNCFNSIKTCIYISVYCNLISVLLFSRHSKTIIYSFKIEIQTNNCENKYLMAYVHINCVSYCHKRNNFLRFQWVFSKRDY